MKRAVDLFLALVSSIIFLPICLITALLIKATSKGPVLHWSKRIGSNNEIFLMPKFRTMLTETPQVATHLLTDPQIYLTPVGGFLRKSSLDELPQLFSILVGDMSFVGPRPALFNQYDLMELRTKYQVHTLKPGVTGWAQINGRDSISIEEKVELDRFYLEKRNLWFDLKIIFLTVWRVLSSRDVSH